MKFLFHILSILLLSTFAARACDICGSTLIQHPWEPRRGLFTGASEQFTRFKTLQLDGNEVSNTDNQFLDSSNTQVFLGYNLTPRFGLQANLPIIDRHFRRIEEGRIQEGRETGVGDASLLATFIPLYYNQPRFTFMARLLAGIKLPTGDSDRLAEEAEEGHSHTGSETDEHTEEAEPLRHRAHNGVEHTPQHEEPAGEAPESAVHGHDLALGSGSVDAITGASIYTRFERAFFSGEVQYTIRSEGSHDYRYANDLTWSGGPGFYLKDDPDLTLAVQLVCSGESKGRDRFRGEAAADTAATTVYLGPKFSGTLRERISAEVELDVPIYRDNSALQLVPDYRVRLALAIQF